MFKEPCSESYWCQWLTSMESEKKEKEEEEGETEGEEKNLV